MKTSHKPLAVLVTLLISIAPLVAQQLPAGPQVLTFFSDADDTEQPYALYIPKNYDPQKKYPLVVMLHGAGSNHRLALRRVFGKSNAPGETDVEATRYFPEWKDVEYIVAATYARGTAGYQGIPEKDVYDMLADVKKRFTIDEDRTYLTGLSMGGGGTLWIGLSRPDIWAALAPVCPAPPNGTDVLAPNAFNVPMHFFHGDQDQAVPVSVSRDWVKRLKDSGTQVEYKEYPGVNHNSWENAYNDGSIFSWFSQFKRNQFPDRVRFSSANYKYNNAYWVTLDQLTPGTLASIDVKFTATNQLDITTTNLDAFTLKLTNHPQFRSDQPLTMVINGGKKMKVPATTDFSMKQADRKWMIGKFEPSLVSKKQNAEGPIRAAFNSRHIYVYGTSGNPSPEELDARRSLAEEAANWAVYRGAFLGRVMFFPRIVSDKEVRPSDLESSNLILFGTKETNAILEKYSDRLPLHLNPSATKDHGLFYVFPMDGHYIAVSSGLPWWTGQQVQGFRFMSSPAIRIQDFKDFLIFKEGTTNIIADGYFDQAWRIPDADRKKLVSAGVVAVKP
ncbi:MAG: prolyl oligopeptidase family serine peptidase [Cyclobacteriaceae bacterium]|nr:prolyl oligopeptidase family serine peptidase [Cyclobacteriaceae bacterium]